MALAENNYRYNEQDNKLLTGWHKVRITEITEPRETQSGNATGFWINFDVRVGNKTEKRGVWLSFDHPSEYVTTKSANIGAMMRMMFPAITVDEDYVGGTFWLLFKTYKEKATGKEREQFFDSKHNVSFDGLKNLYGESVENEDGTPLVSSPPKWDGRPGGDFRGTPAQAAEGEDIDSLEDDGVPF